jgi:hypothetical protein
MPPQREHDALPIPPADTLPLPGQAEALETQITALQEHVTHLIQEVLHERQLRSEQRLGTLETLLLQMRGTSPTSQAFPQKPQEKPRPTSEQEPLEPPKGRSSVLPPLVEYTADGSSMILSPTDGELAFPPDSPQWFAWLETLSSLHFKGQQGSFGLHRRSGHQSWQARCERNGRRYYQSLSHTSLITVAALEQIAATIQSSVPSH